MKGHSIPIICLLVMLTFLIQSVHSLSINSLSEPSHSAIIFVDIDNKDGPWLGTADYPFQTVREGVISAKDGDFVFIADGIYYEHSILLNKSIHIKGQDKEQTIVDIEYEQLGFLITTEHVIIESLTVRNSSGFKQSCGIRIDANNAVVSDCVIKRTRSGIIIQQSKYAEVINSTFYLNGEGILAYDSQNLLIDSCEFCHNSLGANIQYSSLIKIRHSQAHENGVGMLFNSSKNVNISSTGFYDNNDNQGGCFISNSQDFSFQFCTIQHNGFGSRISNTTKICFDQCRIRYNTHFCFYVSDESNITIKRSIIENNLRYGIYLFKSNCIVSECNIIENSIDGVHLSNAECNAANNYWGNINGPFFSEARLVDRIMLDAGRLIVYPWTKKPIKGIGNGVIIEEKFTKTKILGYQDAPLKLNGTDTDEDGVPDWWEELYGYDSRKSDDHIHLDPDDDAITNIYECYAYDMGADPFKKDVFLEFDWMPGLENDISNRPPDNYLSQIIQRFQDHDISLHIDTGGDNGKGSLIPLINNFDFDVLRDLYWEYFLENDLRNPRKYIFHYGLICNTGPGNGFAFIGWGQLNAFCISADVLQANNIFDDRGHLIASGSMHELGHNLGLFVDDFGGNDNTAATRPWYKEYYKYWNYKSCMNYRYTYQILDYSGGQNGNVDYDDWGNLQYDFFLKTSFDLPTRFW